MKISYNECCPFPIQFPQAIKEGIAIRMKISTGYLEWLALKLYWHETYRVGLMIAIGKTNIKLLPQ